MPDRWSTHHLQQNNLRLTLLPGIGGRLWDIDFQGRSLLFQNPDLKGLKLDDTCLADLPTRSPQFGFPLWGGEKTWIAPDASWTDGAPFPVLDSGPYQISSKSSTHIEMTSAICPDSHLSVSRRISLTSSKSWDIAHTVTNHGSAVRETGIWSVMMLKTPSKIGMAMDIPHFDPVFGNAEGIVAENSKSVVSNCTRLQEFKIGLPNPYGHTLIRCGQDGPLLLCSVPKPREHNQFAHRHPFEVFNSGDYAYCEAEWHSPVRTLAQNETMSFQQTFCFLTDGDGSQMPKAIKQDEEFLSCMS